MMTLPDYIYANLETPFEWGRHDCVLFASNWVKEAAGLDCVDGLGTWSTAREAKAAIKRAGGLVPAIDARLTRIEPNFAQDGDIALQNGTVMIFSGAHIVGPGGNGLVFIGREKAECAWRLKCHQQ